MNKKEFEVAFKNAIDVITEIQSGMKDEKIVKIILPVNIAKEIKSGLPITKSNFDTDVAYFCGIPCEVKAGIDNIQYVIERIVK